MIEFEIRLEKTKNVLLRLRNAKMLKQFTKKQWTTDNRSAIRSFAVNTSLATDDVTIDEIPPPNP